MYTKEPFVLLLGVATYPTLIHWLFILERQLVDVMTLGAEIKVHGGII
jgi:hypothetical protein